MARLFILERDVDLSGSSGTGRIAEGVQFSDGQAVIHWTTDGPNATGFYASIEDVERIHGHGGTTRIVLL